MPEYVYCIVDPAAPAPAESGIAGAPLRLIEGGGVAALVSAFDADEVLLGRDDVMTHTRVLDAALAAGPVLPMRLGTVMSNPEAVRARLLDKHADDLRAQLERLRGKFEANVRATYDESALMREVVSDRPDIARLRAALRGRPPEATYPDRIRLGELVAETVQQIRKTDARNVIDALSQVALATRVSPPAHERVAVNAAFLLDRARASEFDAVLDAFAEGQAGRLRFKYAGPLPPHSFVELSGVA
jgi:hypothetical protein